MRGKPGIALFEVTVGGVLLTHVDLGVAVSTTTIAVTLLRGRS